MNFGFFLKSFDNVSIHFSACKVLAVELETRLQETGKTSEVLELGYSLDDVKEKKRTQYRKS